MLAADLFRSRNDCLRRTILFQRLLSKDKNSYPLAAGPQQANYGDAFHRGRDTIQHQKGAGLNCNNIQYAGPGWPAVENDMPEVNSGPPHASAMHSPHMKGISGPPQAAQWPTRTQPGATGSDNPKPYLHPGMIQQEPTNGMLGFRQQQVGFHGSHEPELGRRSVDSGVMPSTAAVKSAAPAVYAARSGPPSRSGSRNEAAAAKELITHLSACPLRPLPGTQKPESVAQSGFLAVADEKGLKLFAEGANVPGSASKSAAERQEPCEPHVQHSQLGAMIDDSLQGKPQPVPSISCKDLSTQKSMSTPDPGQVKADVRAFLATVKATQMRSFCVPKIRERGIAWARKGKEKTALTSQDY